MSVDRKPGRIMDAVVTIGRPIVVVGGAGALVAGLTSCEPSTSTQPAKAPTLASSTPRGVGEFSPSASPIHSTATPNRPFSGTIDLQRPAVPASIARELGVQPGTVIPVTQTLDCRDPNLIRAQGTEEGDENPDLSQSDGIDVQNYDDVPEAVLLEGGPSSEAIAATNGNVGNSSWAVESDTGQTYVVNSSQNQQRAAIITARTSVLVFIPAFGGFNKGCFIGNDTATVDGIARGLSGIGNLGISPSDITVFSIGSKGQFSQLQTAAQLGI